MVVVGSGCFYIPCFFCSSRSSFQRVLTPSIMVWTSCSQKCKHCDIEPLL